MKLLTIRAAKAAIYVLPMTVLTALIDLAVSLLVGVGVFSSDSWEASYLGAVFVSFKWVVLLSVLVWIAVGCIYLLDDSESIVRNLNDMEHKELKRLADKKNQLDRDEAEVKRLIEV